MKNYLLLLTICCTCSAAFGQKVGTMNVNEMNERIAKGKDTTFIINFWATWCGPCLKELPNFEQLGQHLKNEKAKVLLVSVDFKTELNASLIPFVKRKKIKNEVFLLNETNQQEYISRIDSSWSGAIPATLFVKSGKRRFVEKEFTYPDLIKEFKNLQ